MSSLQIGIRIRLATVFASAMLVTLLIALALGSLWQTPSADWRSLGRLLAIMAHAPVNQWLGVWLWIAFCAVLFVVGFGGHPRRRFGLAILSGALLPIGFWLLAMIEGRVWPALRDTTSPLDRPLLSLPLLLYCVAASWLLGRLGRAGHREVFTP